ncbi:MAG: calcium-translocating P-type ATPase, PMCA-type [Prevotella sp.]|nr:calcium-translocating P-type ATPase, PMCA-type [Prevotella sp.]MBP3745226.1 calcium-translocating P-type ATPase, PMCA-type [Prevotella sp.]
MTRSIKYEGLSDRQVAESRRLYGINVLTPVEKEPLWKRFLEKFADPLIVILLVAGLMSVGISFYEFFGLGADLSVFFEPVGIFMAVFLATSLAFIFEYKADREFSLLSQADDEQPVKVVRNGHVCQVAKRDVVVGDTVMVQTGDEIPADGTLLDATTLSIDESTLTGEPVCTKTADPAQFDAQATFPSNELLRGTKVMDGHGVFCVSRVGDNTENGKVFAASQIDDSVKTPLGEQLERLGQLISRMSYGVAGLVVAGRIVSYLWLTPDYDAVGLAAHLLQTVMIAVSLIVVAVPEGLPMAVTLSLAYSMRRMLKTQNLVRKMHACETMGAVTVICTDKTGTLTQNKMQVAELYSFHGQDAGGKQQEVSQALISNMALCSTAELDGQEVIGNPTEGALLLWLRAQGIDFGKLCSEAEVVDEEPFSTERKYMRVTVRIGERTVSYIKGAPEIVMQMCDMTEEEAADYRRKLLEYQQGAMRTLAFACREHLPESSLTPSHPSPLTTFLGIAAISDPVRSDVPLAVDECQRAGIDIKIVTGDTTATAIAIARQIGIRCDGESQTITGRELAELTDDELLSRCRELKVVSRARPMDKKRLVEALQNRGEVVAVTGDGTNDAPALKLAHVGLSMGNGTAVAKEASDITIIDNSFSSIGRAVMWGRSLYRNIQRFILFQLTVNVVACLTVLVGAFADVRSPLTVTQMLWVNLIMDTFAAMALASLPPNSSVMAERPRNRKAFIISHPMRWFIGGVGLAMTAVLLVVYFYFHITDGFSPYDQSAFFTIFVMMQFWNMLNAKAFLTGRSAFSQLWQSREFLFVASMIFVGQVLIVQFGGRMFNTVPLSLFHWVVITACTSLVFLFGEVWRMFEGRFKK